MTAAVFNNTQSRLFAILKYLRGFVQSDWFLLVFISHNRDTACIALAMCHTYAPGPRLIH